MSPPITPLISSPVISHISFCRHIGLLADSLACFHFRVFTTFCSQFWMLFPLYPHGAYHFIQVFTQWSPCNRRLPWFPCHYLCPITVSLQHYLIAQDTFPCLLYESVSSITSDLTYHVRCCILSTYELSEIVCVVLCKWVFFWGGRWGLFRILLASQTVLWHYGRNCQLFTPVYIILFFLIHKIVILC